MFHSVASTANSDVFYYRQHNDGEWIQRGRPFKVLSRKKKKKNLRRPKALVAPLLLEFSQNKGNIFTGRVSRKYREELSGRAERSGRHYFTRCNSSRVWHAARKSSISQLCPSAKTQRNSRKLPSAPHLFGIELDTFDVSSTRTKLLRLTGEGFKTEGRNAAICYLPSAFPPRGETNSRYESKN